MNGSPFAFPLTQKKPNEPWNFVHVSRLACRKPSESSQCASPALVLGSAVKVFVGARNMWGLMKWSLIHLVAVGPPCKNVNFLGFIGKHHYFPKKLKSKDPIQ